MKYLTISAAALFLITAPATVFAQSDNSGGSGSGTTNGSGASTDQNTGGSGQAGSTGNQAGTGSDSQCNDQTASAGYESFSEKCRGQIDAWAQGQTGASTAFQGDLAVGVVVPESVAIIEVPAYRGYGYAMLNDHRVLVDRSTRKVMKVY